MRSDTAPRQNAARHIGTTEITQGNIDNNHIYLRSFFERFPADAIGGSNRASAAQREIAVDWGGATVVMTDLDGQKKFFRKRAWIREFFERHGPKTVIIARFVPRTKKDCEAARLVITPAVAAGGSPFSEDCVVCCKAVRRSTWLSSRYWYWSLFAGEYAGAPPLEAV